MGEEVVLWEHISTVLLLEGQGGLPGKVSVVEEPEE